MTNNELEKLINLKKSQNIAGGKPIDDFMTDFFKKVDSKRRARKKIIVISSIAALFAILLGITVLPNLKSSEKSEESNMFALIDEAYRFFGDEVAILSINGELLTGARYSSGGNSQRIMLSLVDSKNNQKSSMFLVATSNDFLEFEENQIVISKCDDNTLIADCNLMIDGKLIRAIIPIKKERGNRYIGEVNLS